MTFRWIAVAALAVSAEARGASAQEPRLATSATAAEIGKALRRDGDPGDALNVLLKRRRTTVPGVIDAIADTLAEVAIHFRDSGVVGTLARVAAVRTLFDAGSDNGSTSGPIRSVRYTRATERLRTISELSHDVGARGLALKYASELDSSATQTSYLRSVAISGNAVAYVAIRILGLERGQEGQQVVREIMLSGVVKEELSVISLAMVARKHGWR